MVETGLHGMLQFAERNEVVLVVKTLFNKEENGECQLGASNALRIIFLEFSRGSDVDRWEKTIGWTTSAMTSTTVEGQSVQLVRCKQRQTPTAQGQHNQFQNLNNFKKSLK